MISEPTPSNQCPPLELWWAYADKSLETALKEQIEPHLQGCDRCATAVLAAQRALQESENNSQVLKTPRATSPQQQTRSRWPAYAAAAVLVVGVGLYSLFYSSQPAYYSTELAFSQLADLDQKLQNKGFSWTAITGPSTKGFLPTAPPLAPITSEGIAPRAQAGIRLGAAIIQLKLLTAYQQDNNKARIHLLVLGEILDQINANIDYNQQFKILATLQKNISTADVSLHLNDLHREIETFIDQQGDEILLYYRLGQWLFTTKTISLAAFNTSIPFPTLAATKGESTHIYQFTTELQAVNAPQALLESLNKIATALEAAKSNPKAAQTIIIQAEAILRAISYI